MKSILISVLFILAVQANAVEKEFSDKITNGTYELSEDYYPVTYIGKIEEDTYWYIVKGEAKQKIITSQCYVKAFEVVSGFVKTSIFKNAMDEFSFAKLKLQGNIFTLFHVEYSARLMEDGRAMLAIRPDRMSKPMEFEMGPGLTCDPNEVVSSLLEYVNSQTKIYRDLKEKSDAIIDGILAK